MQAVYEKTSLTAKTSLTHIQL